MAKPALAPGARLGHFTVVAYLGAGNMGEVYRALDDRLKREVALKVLPEDTAGDPGARARLLREARSAAALNHPHICTIHEVGEELGQDFIAMELVEGRPLNEVGGVAGFAPSTTVRVGIEIADALSHAHDHHVVHRDLKGANVMLTSDSRVKVMDFGLARQVSTADSSTMAPGQTLTESGMIVGTTHFMAPEVLVGGAADARSDIWALGVVLYEMAAGGLPFDGHTRYEVAAAIMHSAARPLPESVPAGLKAVIARCLEKEPARRYQHAGEVRAALETVGSDAAPAVVPRTGSVRRPAARNRTRYPNAWPILGALIGVLAAVVLIFNRDAWLGPLLGKGGAGGERSLAVLPLENLSHDPEQAYFADGMTEEISTRLAQIAALRVIAQSSVLDLVKKQKSLPAIGRALRVPVLLRGSVLRVTDRVRITVQLVKAATGDLMWAQSYERSLMDVLSLQSEVALAIAREIQVHLTPQEHTRLAASRPIDPEAYQAYLKGRALWNKFTRESFEASERQFRRAIDIAPDYAPAWAGLADAIYGMSSNYMAPNDAIPKARVAAEKALSLDPSLAEAHTSIGIIKMVFDWDWPGAEREFERAIELRPGDSNAHLWLGRLLVARGRFDEGVAAARRALDLDPLSSFVTANVALNLYFARRYDLALEHLRGAIATDPDYNFFRFILGLTLEQKGDHAGAIAALEKSVEVDAGGDNLAQLAHVYGAAGRRAHAERTIGRMLELRKNSFVPAADLAFAYTGLGERDKAIEWLQLALEDHSEYLGFLNVEPGFDPIRPDPRVAAVLRRVKLEP